MDTTRPAPPRHLALLGLTGAGKTTIGRLLSAHLTRPLLDSDEWIEEVHGATGRQIAATAGVAELHRVERDATLAMLDHPEPAIIAVPASAVDDVDARSALSRLATCVWLTAATSHLVARVQRQEHRRPLDAADLDALLTARRDHFAALAQIVVATGERSPTAITGEVVTALRALGIS